MEKGQAESLTNSLTEQASVRWSADSIPLPAPRNNAALPGNEHRARERFKYMLGVMPQKRLKCRAK